MTPEDLTEAWRRAVVTDAERISELEKCIAELELRVLALEQERDYWRALASMGWG